MARGFGSTLGSGTTDVLAGAYTGDSGGTTWGVWTYRNGEGGGNFGRIFDTFSSSVGTARILFNRLDVTAYEFQYAWSGQNDAAWRIARPAASGWVHVLITYDPSSTSNDPIIYVNGSSVTVTRITAPSGTASTSTETYGLGNRKSDGIRVWDGMLAEFFIATRIWTVDEAAAVGSGKKSPNHYPRNLVAYQPHVRDTVDVVRGGAFSVTGTAVQPHPPVRYLGRSTRRAYASIPRQALPAGALLGVA